MITLVAMIGVSFIVGLIWSALLGFPIPSYLAGMIGGLTALPVWNSCAGSGRSTTQGWSRHEAAQARAAPEDLAAGAGGRAQGAGGAIPNPNIAAQSRKVLAKHYASKYQTMRRG